ncbi:MAG: hypothetical protein WC868_11370 [Bacteroidales bacterium]
MKKLIFCFFLLIFCFSFTSCKKDEKRTIVEVTALDKTTNNVIPNAKITLVAETSSTFMGPSYYAVIEEKYTNIAGKFTFDFKANKSYGYFLVASAEHYYNTDEHTGNIENSKMNYVAIPLQPEGFLKVFIKNTTPFDNADKIYVGSYDIDLGGYYYGTAVDTFTIGRTWGNVNRNLNWQVTKNEMINNYSTYIFVTAYDTTIYTINY